MESVIVLGLGEVGRLLYEIIRSSGLYKICGYDIRKDAAMILEKMCHLVSSKIFQMILIIFM